MGITSKTGHNLISVLKSYFHSSSENGLDGARMEAETTLLGNEGS